MRAIEILCLLLLAITTAAVPIPKGSIVNDCAMIGRRDALLGRRRLRRRRRVRRRRVDVPARSVPRLLPDGARRRHQFVTCHRDMRAVSSARPTSCADISCVPGLRCVMDDGAPTCRRVGSDLAWSTLGPKKNLQ